jgi:CheY-like chemotaxis protein
MKRNQPPSLLVIEDSDEDFEALSRIINQVCTFPIAVHRCVSGDDALDFLSQAATYHDLSDDSKPGLILLDLNLPGTDGREVLSTIKQSQSLKKIPVVVLSTSSNPKDIEDCYQSGVSSYILKPMNINELKESIRIMLDYWFKVTVLSDATMPLATHRSYSTP